mmetsp:Transcript_129394/g.235181  ORF Transcript_129394/g.235181 Transcript_129394/m.235181 type:complete len:983 (-) Transcript_129394:200-3148(-)
MDDILPTGVMSHGLYGSPRFMENRSSSHTNCWGVQKPDRMLDFTYESATHGTGYIACEGRRVCQTTMTGDGFGSQAVPYARDMPEAFNMLSRHMQKYAEYLDQTCDEIYNTMVKQWNEMQQMQHMKQAGSGLSYFKGGVDSSGNEHRLATLETKMREFQRTFDMANWKGQVSSPRGVLSSDDSAYGTMESRFQDLRKTVEMVEHKVHDEQEDLRTEVLHLKQSVKGNYSPISKSCEYNQRIGNIEVSVQDLQRMFDAMKRQLNMDQDDLKNKMQRLTSAFSSTSYGQGMGDRVMTGDLGAMINEMNMTLKTRREVGSGADHNSYSNLQFKDNMAAMEEMQRMFQQRGRDEHFFERQMQDLKRMIEMVEKKGRDEQHKLKGELFKMMQSYSAQWQDAGSNKWQGNMQGMHSSPRDTRGDELRSMAGSSPRDHRLVNVEARVDDLRSMVDMVEKKLQMEQKEIREQGRLMRQFPSTNMAPGSGLTQELVLRDEKRLGNLEANFQDLQRMVEKVEKKAHFEHDELRNDIRKMRDAQKLDVGVSSSPWQSTRSTRQGGDNHHFEVKMQDLQRTIEQVEKKCNFEQDEIKVDMQKLREMVKVNNGSNNWQNFRSSKYQGNIESKMQDLVRTVEKNDMDCQKMQRTVDKAAMDRQDMQRSIDKVEQKMLFDQDELRSELQKFMQSIKFDIGNNAQGVHSSRQYQGNLAAKFQDLERTMEKVEQRVQFEQNELRNEVHKYLQNMCFDGERASGDWQSIPQSWQDQRLGNLETRIQDMQRILEMVSQNFEQEQYPMTGPNKNFMSSNLSMQPSTPAFGGTFGKRALADSTSNGFGTFRNPMSMNDLPMVPGQRPGGFLPTSPLSSRPRPRPHSAHGAPGVTKISGAIRELEAPLLDGLPNSLYRDNADNGFSRSWAPPVQSELEASISLAHQKKQKLESELQKNEQWLQRSMNGLEQRRPSIENISGKQPTRPHGSPVQGRPTFPHPMNV